MTIACARPSDLEPLRNRLDALEARESLRQARTDSSIVELGKEIRLLAAKSGMRNGAEIEAHAELQAKITDLDRSINELRSGLTPVAAPESLHVVDIELAELYRHAYFDMTRGDFELAREGFEQFLELAGDSLLRPDAHFWLGECHFVADRFEAALESFRAVIQAETKSERLPAALLKLGLCEIELGFDGDARGTLARVIDEFPETDEAKIAREHVRRIELR
ncbi:MAG: tol-pal system protein YbgF [Gemmatimonadetes bacterium]|nr:tol-pal system protein YbgF [Gemmatimonadota bacterium]